MATPSELIDLKYDYQIGLNAEFKASIFHPLILTVLNENGATSFEEIKAYNGNIPLSNNYINTSAEELLQGINHLTNLGELRIASCELTGELPSLGGLKSLSKLHFSGNKLSGKVESFSHITGLAQLYIHANSFTGFIPDVRGCTGLSSYRAFFNQFDNYPPGSFETQANLSTLDLSDNDLVELHIDRILADLVESLDLVGRVNCTVDLSGNVPPSASGESDKTTLINAGWSVTTD